jgi:malate dehydrogenase (oxaloacetate-decarboxylating)
MHKLKSILSEVIGADVLEVPLFMAAARAVADCSPSRHDPAGSLLPPLSESRRVSRTIALAVAAAAQSEGLAELCPPEEIERLVDARMWTPRYLPMKRKPA